MGLFFSKSKDVEEPKSQVLILEVQYEAHPSSLLANLDALLKALHHIETLKMAIESEILSENVLMSNGFEAMQSARLKLDQEMECIQDETEKQIIKYKDKAKSFT